SPRRRQCGKPEHPLSHAKTQRREDSGGNASGFPEPKPDIAFVVLSFLDVRPSICMPKSLRLLITASRQYLFPNISIALISYVIKRDTGA
ncbi:MAG: hypothetical protein LBD14_01680, partial [Puniceicoccales bacterium]|nr:hypothetical protein [Puniceicoccales bacterium]